MDIKALEDRVSAAFHGGEVRRRELRLTAEEAEYAQKRYDAQVAPMGADWYEITFGGLKNE